MSIEVAKLSVSGTNDVDLIRVSGVIDQIAAGPLYDTLFDIIGKGRGRLIVDMSGVDLLTRAAARSLVVAAKLLQAPHGAMRICGARAGVGAMLDGLGHANLLKRDRDLRASIEALTGGERRPMPHTTSNLGTPHPANTNVAAAADGTYGMLK